MLLKRHPIYLYICLRTKFARNFLYYHSDSSFNTASCAIPYAFENGEISSVEGFVSRNSPTQVFIAFFKTDMQIIFRDATER